MQIFEINIDFWFCFFFLDIERNKGCIDFKIIKIYYLFYFIFLWTIFWAVILQPFAFVIPSLFTLYQHYNHHDNDFYLNKCIWFSDRTRLILIIPDKRIKNTITKFFIWLVWIDKNISEYNCFYHNMINSRILYDCLQL